MTINALIVDDESIVRKGLRHMVPWDKFGIAIVGEASSADKALEFLALNPVKLLFTDITMPGMSGLELLEQVSERYPELMTVILTCHQDFEYIQEALRLGAIDYIVKTQLENLEQLLTRIVIRINNQAARQAHVEVEKMTQPSVIGSDLKEINELWSSLQWIMNDTYFKSMVAAVEQLPDKDRTVVALKAYQEWREKLPFALPQELQQDLAETSFHKWIEMLQTNRDAIKQKLLKSGYSEDIIQSILKSVSYMNHHVGRRLNQNEICIEVNMSKSYFSKSFKDIMDISFFTYLQEVHIRYAKTLLTSTNQPIYTIAEKCGFLDEKYFSKVFKLKIGQLPSEYRQSNRD
ncbi:response regulator [Paenibacillus psychroresistens]|uniref:Response regulator n=1 Tax=Paenibacillus psychroresistens TaxID=1778678 RepID=A0A6B8RPY2_9BACL|nr:response regulator [Paenibacillus psychroresistens]QGQ97752.1 response regulator [Paenibacillus psychroresistens]